MKHIFGQTRYGFLEREKLTVKGAENAKAFRKGRKSQALHTQTFTLRVRAG
jgi:hypothetical protein